MRPGSRESRAAAAKPRGGSVHEEGEIDLGKSEVEAPLQNNAAKEDEMRSLGNLTIVIALSALAGLGSVGCVANTGDEDEATNDDSTQLADDQVATTQSADAATTATENTGTSSDALLGCGGLGYAGIG